MTDIASKPLIVLKGMLFLILAASASTLLWLERPSVTSAILLAVLAWSASRFYYFLFYVLGHYVNPELRYAGILALLGQLWRSRAAR